MVNQLRTMNEGLKAVLDSKEEGQWDGINEQYEKFAGFMD